MRRRVRLGAVAAVAVAVAAGLAALLTATTAAPAATPVRVAGLHQTADRAATGPDAVLDRLTAPGGLARYRLPTGQLVYARVCVAGSCADRQLGSTSPRCQNGACLAPASSTRRYPGGLLITVEEW